MGRWICHYRYWTIRGPWDPGTLVLRHDVCTAQYIPRLPQWKRLQQSLVVYCEVYRYSLAMVAKSHYLEDQYFSCEGILLGMGQGLAVDL